MQCPICGRQVSNGARFCPVCGNPIPASYTEPQQMEPAQSQSYSQAQPQPQPQSRYQQQHVQSNAPINRAMPLQAPMPNTQMGQQVPPSQNYAVDSTAKTMSIVSLVFGMLGILIAIIMSSLWTPLVYVGLALGIVGIVLASISKKRGFESALSTAGLVCSIVAAVFSAVFAVYILTAPM